MRWYYVMIPKWWEKAVYYLIILQGKAALMVNAMTVCDHLEILFDMKGVQCLVEVVVLRQHAIDKARISRPGQSNTLLRRVTCRAFCGVTYSRDVTDIVSVVRNIFLSWIVTFESFLCQVNADQNVVSIHTAAMQVLNVCARKLVYLV